jgi:hypothetical protein
MDREVAIACRTCRGRSSAHALGEDLGAAAGQRVEAASISSRSTCSSVMP